MGPYEPLTPTCRRKRLHQNIFRSFVCSGTGWLDSQKEQELAKNQLLDSLVTLKRRLGFFSPYFEALVTAELPQ